MLDINDILVAIKKHNVDDLKRESKDFNFEDVHGNIKTIYLNISKLEKHEDFWQELPQNNKNDIRASLTLFSQQLERITNFDPTQSNPTDVRRDIANKITQSYDSLFNKLITPLQPHILNDFIESKKFKDKLQETQEEVDTIKNFKKDAEAALGAIKDYSASLGVSEFANVFKTAADENKERAAKWFWATIVVSIILSIVLIFFAFELIKVINANELNIDKAIQIFFIKILLISFFSVIFYKLIKNYNAYMHLYTVNKHRENCMKTFDIFHKSPKDPNTKDLVLIQATKAIFEIGDTGLIASKDGAEDSQFINIVDRLKSK